ncbi:flagellar export chaperone FliS [Quadrisphaera sp. GCM10027208]|uniref:flagellar export chaperone FliS n=1 Tax=Quadrisphaera sp. GCM10027208 TaxID=3273423 RepID=UPI00360A5B55
MSTSALARSRYARDSVTTASPARLLVMLYDRLVRDLVTAERALAEQGGAPAGDARDALLHAQEIVLELRASLDLDAWDGAAGLADLYAFLHGELVAANVDRDVTRITPCRQIAEELRDAWRQAALATVSP